MKCMVCKNDFESLVEFAGKTVCEDCYDRPSMVVVKLIESYLRTEDLDAKDKLYNQLK